MLTALLPVALGEQVDPSPGLLAEECRLEIERNQPAMVLEWNAREDGFSPNGRQPRNWTSELGLPVPGSAAPLVATDPPCSGTTGADSGAAPSRKRKRRRKRLFCPKCGRDEIYQFFMRAAPEE